MKLNSLIFLVTAAFIWMKCTTPEIRIDAAVIPVPQELNYTEGVFKLSDRTEIISTTQQELSTANYLAVRIRNSTGFPVRVGNIEKTGSSSIQLVINENLADKGKEYYELTVGKKNILVSSGFEAGLFYGCQTLLQLFPAEIYSDTKVSAEWLAPCLEIKDGPLFEWRGLMIDIARHFFGPETLKKIIDQMAIHKLNRMHLHLSDDPGWRVEISGYPELTTVGAIGCESDSLSPPQFLSVDDIKELVDYAREQHIIIIPEIDMPAHSGAIGRTYPELSGGHNTFNVSSDKALAVMQDITSEIMKMFESPYMHFGGDEVREHKWEERKDMQLKMKELKLNNVKELEAWFDRTMATHILSNEKTPVCWDEASEYGVDKKTIVQWWRCLEPDKLIDALKNGYKVIISPPDYVYFDYPYVIGEPGAQWEGIRNGGNSEELIYGWDPVPDNLSQTEKNQILGLEACVWTEYIKTEDQLEFMIFPRLAAFSEQAWSRKENRSFEDYIKRRKIHLDRYSVKNINFRPVNDSLQVQK